MFEIPLTASQAIAEAGRLAASIDGVAASLRNAVTQSELVTQKIQAMGKDSGNLKTLSDNMAGVGVSIRKLEADTRGQINAMSQLTEMTKRSTQAHAQFSQQYLRQQGRVIASLEKEGQVLQKLAALRINTDKAVLSSSMGTSSAIIAQMKEQNAQVSKNGSAWANSQKEQIAAVQVLQREIAALNKSLAERDAAVKKATQASNQAAQAERDHATALAKSKSEQQKLTDAVNRANLALSAQRAQSQGAVAASAGLTASTIQATSVSQLLRNKVAQTTQGLSRYTRSTHLASQGTAAMRAGMIASGTSFGIFTSETIIAAVAVYGLVSAMKAVIVAGAEFEDKMVRAFAIMGVSGDFAATKELTAFVREIGSTTKFTATEAAEGLVLLGMAGLDTQQAMDALRPSLNIASIGMVDMAFAADLVTNVMNEFGMQSTDIAHISDVLATAVTGANVNIEQLGLSLSYIGPIAASTNNSLEDTVGMIQIMGDNAIKASRAGTALRRAMANLLDPNEEATATMVRLGVSIKNVDGEMIPLIDFMKQLAGAGADVTDVFTLFGLYAAPGMMTVLEDLKKGFDENGNAIEGYIAKVENYAGKLSNVAGEAERLRKNIENTVKADAELFTSALNDVALVSFDEIHAQLRLFLHNATELVRNLDPDAIRSFTRGVVNLAEGLGTLVKWGVGLYAMYKTIQFGAVVFSGAALAIQAMSFAAGSSVGPLTSQAAALQGAQISIMGYTPAALRGASASLVLSTSLSILGKVFWPLMIIGVIAGAMYSFANASSTAAADSAKLRAEMGAEEKQAERLKKSLEELTEVEKERMDAADRTQMTANNSQIEVYKAEMEEVSSGLVILQDRYTRAMNLMAMGNQLPTGFMEQQELKIQQMLDDLTLIQDKIDTLEQNNQELSGNIGSRSEYNGGRPSGIAESTRQAEILAATLTEAQGILSGIQYAASDSITNLQNTESLGADFTLKELVDAEIKKSDARIEIFESEQKEKDAIQEVFLARQSLVHENYEKNLVTLKKDYAERSHQEALNFIDQEIAYTEENNASLWQRYQSNVNDKNLGGEVLADSKTAYIENTKRLRELMDTREEFVHQYVTEQGELSNQGLSSWTAEEERIRSLVSAYDPLMGALLQRLEHEKAIQYLLDKKLISEEAAVLATQQAQFAYESVRTPIEDYRYALESEIELLLAQEVALKTSNYQQLVAIQLKQAGITATEEEIAVLAESMRMREDIKGRNKDLAKDADVFQKAWEEAIKRVDEAFENMWMGAFDSFTSFRDQLVDAFKQLMATLAHETISKPILINMGVLPAQSIAGGGSAASRAASAGNSATGLSGMYGMLSGGLTQTLAKTSGYAASVLQNMGFESLATSAARQSSAMAAGGTGALMNAGLSAVGGFAGNYAGNKLGESILGKQAESAIASTIMGTIGAIIGGPLGSFLGATIGSFVDVAFGGDGKERMSAGFSVGPAAVRDKYQYGTQTFDSGLEVTNIARRVDQQTSDKIIETFAVYDSLFTSITEASGRKVDLSKANLQGSSADAGGGGSGSFFGVKDYNGLGSLEEQMAAQSKDFVLQLIAQVSGGFSEEVKRAIDSATGDAEQILTQYEAVLSLDSIFQSGSKLFTNVDTFQQTMDVLAEQFMQNGESLGKVVNDIKSANESLSLVGMGDGSSSFSKTALQIAEAAGGVENLDAMIRNFADTVVGRERELENVTSRLKDAVKKQFNEIGLSVENFDTDSFREHFDQVKDSLSAIDVVKLIQAGNALGLLTQLETELAEVRAESFKEFSQDLEESLSLMEDVRSLRESIQSKILDITSIGVAPSGPASDSLEDRLDYMRRLSDFYMDQYDNEVEMAEDLHKKEVENYKEKLKLSEQIGGYLKSLSLGDLSTLTSKEKRDQAYAEFQNLAALAESGDMVAAGKLTDAAQAFLAIERERETTNDKYLASYQEVVGRLSGLKGQYDLASDPGEFSPRVLNDKLVEQLQALNTELNSIENSISSGALTKLESIDQRIAKLPEEIANSLRQLMSADATGVLNYGAGFNVLKTSIVDALKILPDQEQLSSLSIAEHIENLTHLSEFPSLLNQSFSETVGAVLQQMLAQGASVSALADAISNSPLITGATNQYMQNNGIPGSVSDYTSNGQNSQILNHVNSVVSKGLPFEEMAKQVLSDAQANGISSSKLASVWNAANPNAQYSAAELNNIAASLGLPTFGNGGVVSSATMGIFGEKGREVVTPVKDYATLERENLVGTLMNASRAGAEAANRQVVDAINKNTKAVSSNSNSSNVIHLKVVTVDGKVLVDQTIDTMKQRSKNGEIVVHSKGVAK